MLQTHTNNTLIPQVWYDEFRTPHTLEPGQSVVVQKDNTFDDIGFLLIFSIIAAGVTYVGYAQPGTADDAYGWAICTVETVGGVEEKKWAGGVREFRYQWAQRLTYTYS